MASSLMDLVTYISQFGVAEAWDRARHEPEFFAMVVTAFAIPVALLTLGGILWVTLTEESGLTAAQAVAARADPAYVKEKDE